MWLMLGDQLRSMLDSFKRGILKLSARKLSKPDAKLCDRLMNEQRALNERAAKMLDVYERKIEKIAALLEECRQGDIERLAPHIRQLQMDLKNALMRAELAGTETSDLERELADWQYRWRNGSEEPSPRYKSLLLELRSRGKEISDNQYQSDVIDQGLSEEKPIYFDLKTLDEEPDEEEAVGAVIYSNQGATGLETDPEQLVLHIKDLSRELARYKQDPTSEPTESLRMARQIRQLHAILRKIDRKSGDYRDRIGLTDGFEHVFSSH